MKKIIQSVGLMALICFSFMYTDKVMEVISQKDSLMIELENIKDKYKIDSVEGEITKDTIIPGLNGKEVNIEESYKKMRELGIFREDFLIYYTTYPNILLKNNYDKYIIGGNTEKKQVSLIFKITNVENIDKLISIINNSNTKINLFVDSDYLNSNINSLINDNIELHSYGNKGTYTHENILLSKNIIKSKTNQNTIYCLTKDKEKRTINTCSKEKFFTIIPSINTSNNPYNDIKTKLKNGSIINLELNSNTIKELPNIIKFINGKGLEIVTISELLSEDNI